MKLQRQFDGIDRGVALTEVLKEFRPDVLHNFEFDDDTQIAQFDVVLPGVADADAIDSEPATVEVEALREEHDAAANAPPAPGFFSRLFRRGR